MKRFPYHTILLAVFPVLFIYSRNVDETSISEIFMPALVILLFISLVWLLLYFIYRDIRKAGLTASLLLLLIFSYGQIRDVIVPLELPHPQRYLFILSILLFIACAFIVYKLKSEFENLTAFVNSFSIFLILVSGITAVYFNIIDRPSRAETVVPEITGSVRESLPDIYYIITDAYTRADVYQEIYDYDNSAFIQFLENRGFRVAHRSRSNYSQTTLSLPSSLNMIYLDEIAVQMGSESGNLAPLIQLIKENTIISFLKGLGYKSVAFASGYWDTELKDADVYLTPDEFTFSDFQEILLDMTPIPKILSKIYSFQYASRRKIILNILDNLAAIPEDDKPIFVFAHISAPHQPFLFNDKGEALEPGRSIAVIPSTKEFSMADYRRKYCEYTAWLNGKLMDIIDDILSRSESKPIIIIQADHGWNSLLGQNDPDDTALTERMAILNAYFLPDTTCTALYDEITPVNTFRVLFNCYFGTEMEMLEDRVYFSRSDTPYRFIDVTDRTSSLLSNN